MEKPIASLTVRNGGVTLRTKPYEIKTIKVQFSGAAQMAAKTKHLDESAPANHD
jgi:hypothetical protein